MSSDQADLEVIRAAWCVSPPQNADSGSIIALKHARADIDGLRQVLAALERIQSAEQLPRELVAELWGLPYYMGAFIGAGQFQGAVKAELLALQQQFVVELHRILGTPRQIENAIPPTQS